MVSYGLKPTLAQLFGRIKIQCRRAHCKLDKWKSMDFYNPKEFDHPKVFDDPKTISNGSMDFLMADIRMEIVYYEIHCDSF